MASYDELRSAFSSDQLRSRLQVAVCIKAYNVLQEPTPSVERKAWAVSALFANTLAEADRMLRYLLAANKDMEISLIENADAPLIQPQIDSAVDAMFP